MLLPSHKSHVDYLLLSCLLYRNSIQLPVIAAGDNLSFFPAGPLLRRGGAFFIRRRVRGDRLYAAVLNAYLRRLVRDGHMIEFFLEGTRSRTGKVLPPKLGLLNMVVTAALALGNHKVYFQPVSIGYERLMEEGAYARELSGQKKQKENAFALLGISRVLTDRWGRVSVQFGEPFEMSELRDAAGFASHAEVTPAGRRGIVKRLAHQVMHEVNRVTAVTPGSLVGLVLLSHGRCGVGYRDLVAHCRRLIKMVLRLGARATPSAVRRDSDELREGGIREVLKLYVKSGLVEQHVPGDTLTAEGRKRAALYTGTDVIFTVPDSKRLRLDLTKNPIIHWLVDRALIAVGLLCRPQPGEESQPGEGPAIEDETLRTRVLALSRLFKYEFMYRVDTPFDEIFDDVVGDMVSCGELSIEESRVGLGPGHDGLDGLAWVTFHATLIRNFIEGYRVAARSLGALLKGALERKELLTRALRSGERMFLKGEIERSEAVCRPVIDNALSSFCDQGYVLINKEGGLELAESFRSEEAVKAIEMRVTAYLRRPTEDEPWA